ncbi:MAG TPA: TonB-dependent receptor plug domain-containing protein [Bacteroidales bacterium]|nr:TonB-dependent receptor plug domain-containing protein [Bacteroidales bacterium]HOK97660.1 TonB-dependent receptor plug domain-containing protein [Bacteroidales bacterium]HPO64809.1 TonB-dependent receptor plug domain-containing protein [Bacteroidales bacterium]
MSLYRYLFFICINLLYFEVAAQRCKVKGYIYDEVTQEPIAGALCIDSIHMIYTTSDENGHFFMQVPRGKVAITVTYLNYFRNNYEFSCSSDTFLSVPINPMKIDEITIVANEQPIYLQALSGKTVISVKRIDNLPSFVGQTDLFKAMTFLPGINTGKEGKSELYVRGGGRDQNLLLMDEAVIYSPYHAVGFITGVNTDVVKTIDFYKGGFPARYGDRGSSIIDVQLKDGDKYRWHGKFSLGIIASNLLLEGPIIKDKTSLLLGARSSYFHLITSSMMRDFKAKEKLPLSFEKSLDASAYNYSFYDVNAKISHKFNRDNTLEASLYRGNDYLFDGMIIANANIEAWKNISGFDVINQSASIVSSNYLGRGMLLKTSLSYSSYEGFFYYNRLFLNNIEHYKVDQSALNTIEDVTTKSQLFINLGNRHNIRTGVQISRYEYQPGKTHIVNQNYNTGLSYDSIYQFQGDSRLLQLSCFAEDEIRLSEKSMINAGVRMSIVKVKKKSYFRSEPRISYRRLINESMSIKLAYGLAYQYLQGLYSYYQMLEKEIWVGTTSKIPPAYVHQVTAGIWGMFSSCKLEYGMEGFYKKMYNLIDYQSVNPQNSKLSSTFFNNWEEMIAKNGKGEAYGVELFMQKKTERFSGALAYTLSWNYRQFDELNGGKAFPFVFDTRHQANLTIQYDISKMYSGSIIFSINSGARVTLPEAFVESGIFSQSYTVYGELNNYSLPLYHRLDLMTQKKWRTKKGNLHFFRVNVYNVYARKNPSYIFIQNNKIYKRSFFSIIPTVSYGMEF